MRYPLEPYKHRAKRVIKRRRKLSSEEVQYQGDNKNDFDFLMSNTEES